MKKVWNAPAMEELSIQDTQHQGWGGNHWDDNKWGNHHSHKHHGSEQCGSGEHGWKDYPFDFETDEES